MKAVYVYNIDEIPHADDCQLGVVISINRGWHKQRHCGIAFNLHGDMRILHLSSHKQVLCDRTFGHFLCWVKPEMHPNLQQAFTSYLEILGEAVDNGNNQIPYGFRYNEYARIDSDGTLYLGDEECGLTCATYVLTLFSSNGIKLVNLDNWPYRQEDRHWFFQILGYFKTMKDMSLSHFRRIRSEIGSPRFRPEEIAVSTALYNNGAANTDEIWHEGSGLLDYLLEIT